MAITCPAGQILREGYCKSNRGLSETSGKICNTLSESQCKSNSSCIWVEPTCVKDRGKKGKTPKSKQWSKKANIKKGEFSKYFEGSIVKWEEEACRKAGLKMKEDGVSYATAIKRANLPYVFGAISRKERDRCFKGIKEAYGRL